MRPDVFAAIATLVAVTFPVAVQADTIDARCILFREKDDASAITPVACTFSQRQRAVSIQLKNGQRYDFTPVSDEPGNYIDQHGKAVYRQSGLGERSQSYKLSNGSIYVFSDTAALSHASVDSRNPTICTTFVDPDHIMIKIKDGSFFFHETLTKLPAGEPTVYAGRAGIINVMLRPKSGKINVFHERTGYDYYKYTIGPIPFREAPNTMCHLEIEHG
ncbi:MAG: hypothetical protein WA902_19935 [Thermosynechococcaceae cyanobacterium]